MAIVTNGTFWLRYYEGGKRTSVRGLLGPSPVRVTDGYAKWELVDRNKRRAITEWKGTNPLRVEIEIVLDHFNDGLDDPGLRTEEEMRILEKMAGYTFDGDDKPPLLLWDANAPHDDRQEGDLRWVMTKLEWGDCMFTEAGHRCRQYANIELTQHVNDSFIVINGARRNRKKKKHHHNEGSKKKRRYRVKKTDKSLMQIARDQLGNVNLWTEIQKMNKIRDPHKNKHWPKYLILPA